MATQQEDSEEKIPSYPLVPPKYNNRGGPRFMWINVKYNGSTSMRFWKSMFNDIYNVG